MDKLQLVGHFDQRCALSAYLPIGGVDAGSSRRKLLALFGKDPCRSSHDDMWFFDTSRDLDVIALRLLYMMRRRLLGVWGSKSSFS